MDMLSLPLQTDVSSADSDFAWNFLSSSLASLVHSGVPAAPFFPSGGRKADTAPVSDALSGIVFSLYTKREIAEFPCTKNMSLQEKNDFYTTMNSERILDCLSLKFHQYLFSLPSGMYVDGNEALAAGFAPEEDGCPCVIRREGKSVPFFNIGQFESPVRAGAWCASVYEKRSLERKTMLEKEGRFYEAGLINPSGPPVSLSGGPVVFNPRGKETDAVSYLAQYIIAVSSGRPFRCSADDVRSASDDLIRRLSFSSTPERALLFLSQKISSGAEEIMSVMKQEEKEKRNKTDQEQGR